MPARAVYTFMSMAPNDRPTESRTWRHRDDRQMYGGPRDGSAGFIWMLILAALVVAFYAAFGV